MNDKNILSMEEKDDGGIVTLLYESREQLLYLYEAVSSPFGKDQRVRFL